MNGVLGRLLLFADAWDAGRIELNDENGVLTESEDSRLVARSTALSVRLSLFSRRSSPRNFVMCS